jgi:hypothetical protein
MSAMISKSLCRCRTVSPASAYSETTAWARTGGIAYTMWWRKTGRLAPV